MYYEINDKLYRVRGYGGKVTYIECDTLADLFRWVAEYEVQGYPVFSVCSMEPDGTTPKVAVLSNKDYKKLRTRISNFTYAKRKLDEHSVAYEMAGPYIARVYPSRESTSFVGMYPCDDPRKGAVEIDGRVELIDDWLKNI